MINWNLELSKTKICFAPAGEIWQGPIKPLAGSLILKKVLRILFRTQEGLLNSRKNQHFVQKCRFSDLILQTNLSAQVLWYN